MNKWTNNSTADTSNIFNDLENLHDSVIRDFGMIQGRIYKHSKRCIYLTDDKGIIRWCCADDCKMK
jgi:hypothetical protein